MAPFIKEYSQRKPLTKMTAGGQVNDILSFYTVSQHIIGLAKPQVSNIKPVGQNQPANRSDAASGMEFCNTNDINNIGCQNHFSSGPTVMSYNNHNKTRCVINSLSVAALFSLGLLLLLGLGAYTLDMLLVHCRSNPKIVSSTIKKGGASNNKPHRSIILPLN